MFGILGLCVKNVIKGYVGVDVEMVCYSVYLIRLEGIFVLVLGNYFIFILWYKRCILY